MFSCFTRIGILALVMSSINTSHGAEYTSSVNAHVHGLSTLTIVAEQNTLKIELHSPSVDIIGFEHKATSANDIAQLDKAIITLRQHNALFNIQGTHCLHVNTVVDVPPSVASLDEGDTLHHQDELNITSDHHDSHSEIIASYVFQCHDMTKLLSIEVKMFEVFSGMKDINTMWVTQAQQGATRLTPNQPMIVFK